MIIQTNVPAMNAHRNLSINNNAAAKNLEKLSSGYRINRAADDAAGLAISEKMRGQIRGLGMAEQNAKNGISLIQTAEGALSETHAILQRMRELAVQSSNGTYQDEDRMMITKEYDQLKGELDRIAESTHYNGIKLLDGSLGSAQKITTPSVSNNMVEAATKGNYKVGGAGMDLNLTPGIAGVWTMANVAISGSVTGTQVFGTGTTATTFVDGTQIKIDYTDLTGATDSITFVINAGAGISDIDDLADFFNSDPGAVGVITGSWAKFSNTFTAASTDVGSAPGDAFNIAFTRNAGNLAQIDNITILDNTGNPAGAANQLTPFETPVLAEELTITYRVLGADNLPQNKTLTVSAAGLGVNGIATGNDLRDAIMAMSANTNSAFTAEQQAAATEFLDLFTVSGGGAAAVFTQNTPSLFGNIVSVLKTGEDPTATSIGVSGAVSVAAATTYPAGAMSQVSTTLASWGIGGVTAINDGSGSNNLTGATQVTITNTAGALVFTINGGAISITGAPVDNAGNLWLNVGGGDRISLTGLASTQSAYSDLLGMLGEGESINLNFTAVANSDNGAPTGLAMNVSGVPVTGGTSTTPGVRHPSTLAADWVSSVTDASGAFMGNYTVDITNTAGTRAAVLTDSTGATFAGVIAGDSLSVTFTVGGADLVIAFEDALSATLQTANDGISFNIGGVTPGVVPETTARQAGGTLTIEYDDSNGDKQSYTLTAAAASTLTDAASIAAFMNNAVNQENDASLANLMKNFAVTANADGTLNLEAIVAGANTKVTKTSATGDPTTMIAGALLDRKDGTDAVFGTNDYRDGDLFSATPNIFQTSNDNPIVLQQGQQLVINYHGAADGPMQQYILIASNKEPISGAQAIAAAINNDTSAAAMALKAAFTIGSDYNQLKLTANVADGAEFTSKAKVHDFAVRSGATTTSIGHSQKQYGLNQHYQLQLDSTSKFLNIDGQKYQLVDKDSQLEDGFRALVVSQAGKLTHADMTSIAAQLNLNGHVVNATGEDYILSVEAKSPSGKLVFQIGANGSEDQRVSLSINAMDTKSLGESTMAVGFAAVTGDTVAASSIDTETNANKAIDILSGATNMVSAQRADLGALQNRLESALNSLGVAKENLSSAESVIRDVDMAKEMMAFTKNNILVQAAQAMLAQANSLPQGVLQLLR